MTIFLVDDDAPTLQRMASALEGVGPLRCVSPEDARSLLGHAGPALVCFGPHLGQGGARDLAHLAPGSLRMAMTRGANLVQIQELLHAGGVARVFAWPGELQQLRAAAVEALSELERTVRRERVLEAFRAELASGLSLAAIADAAARGVFEASEELPVLVQLWDEGGLVADGLRVADTPDTHWVEAAYGGEMSSDLHTRRLTDGTRSLGEIVVDMGAQPARAAQVLALLEAFALPVALAAGARIRQRGADRAVHAAMIALAGLAGSREHGGGRHVERMAEYVRLLALGLREDGHFTSELSDERIDDIVRAVPLHDIGKLAVPDAILLKPDRLTAEEWRVVQTHAEVGARALDAALKAGSPPPFLRVARDAARSHHEHWDGAGYPRGLVGDHIPLVGRLLALAGVYDAVTSHRPYRAARSHAAALDLLAEMSGSHLDPRMVSSFLARHEQADTIRERLRDERPVDERHWVSV